MFYAVFLKSLFSGLRQFLATENDLKMMGTVFNFTSKAFSFVVKIFVFSYVRKWLDKKKSEVNYKIYNVINWKQSQ